MTGRLLGTSNASNVTKFSASTNGRAIQVTQTATVGNLIHTAVTGTVTFDRIFLYATNTSSSSVVITIEWGGVGTANNVVYSVPAQNTALIIPGWLINNGLLIGAFAGTTAVLNVGGYIEQVY